MATGRYPQARPFVDPDFGRDIDIAALMVIKDREPVPACLINLSRQGFRLKVAHDLPAAQVLRIEVAGWPRLLGRLIWSDGTRLGGMFDPVPSARLYAVISASIEARKADAQASARTLGATLVADPRLRVPS